MRESIYGGMRTRTALLKGKIGRYQFSLDVGKQGTTRFLHVSPSLSHLCLALAREGGDRGN